MDALRSLLGDPLRLLEKSWADRRHDVGEETLYDVEVLQNLEGEAPEGFPVLRADGPEMQVAVRSHDECRLRHALAHPRAVTEIFGTALARHLILAGGAAGAPIGGWVPNDFDFFVVGLAPEQRESFVDDFLGFFRRQRPGFQTVLFRHCLTLRWMDKSKVQLILRIYPSPAAVLNSFDVGSSCVLFDGRRTRLTALGVAAFAQGVNWADPRRRSSTFERRLIKYAYRGHGIGLPYLAPELVRPGSQFSLSGLSAEVGEDGVVALEVAGPQRPEQYSGPSFIAKWWQTPLEQVVVAVRKVLERDGERLEAEDFLLLLRSHPEGLARAALGASFGDYAPPGLLRLLPPVHLASSLAPHGVEEYERVVGASQGLRLVLGWYRADPLRPLTASIRPLPLTAEEWYGPHHRPRPA